jgi:hypothetical protein
MKGLDAGSISLPTRIGRTWKSGVLMVEENDARGRAAMREDSVD